MSDKNLYELIEKMQEQIESLQTQLTALQAQLNNQITITKGLEKYGPIDNPVQPYQPIELPEIDPADFPDISQPIICSRCGQDLSGVLGYVCPVPNCPTGCGGVQC